MTKCGPLLLAAAACAAAPPLVHAQDVKPRQRLTGHRILCCVAFSADGKVLASGDLRGGIKGWDVATGGERVTLSKAVPDDDAGGGVLPQAVLAVALSPDGKLLASGHARGVKLWDVAAGNLSATPDRRRGQVWAVTFSPDGKLLATGGGRTTARVWDVAGRKVQVALRAGDRPFAALAFRGDGKVLASANGNNDAVTLWDVPTGEVKTTIKTNADNVQAVALTADGTLLAAGGGRPPALAGVKERGTLRLWDVATGKERAAFTGHTDYQVQFVAFSADGKRLASADEDTAPVWDVAAGKALATIKVGPIRGAAFSRDGKHLAVASDDVLLYDAPDGK